MISHQRFNSILFRKGNSNLVKLNLNNNSFSKNFSSFIILTTIIGIYTSMMKNEKSEPSTNGMLKKRTSVTIYIGCLTTP